MSRIALVVDACEDRVKAIEAIRQATGSSLSGIVRAIAERQPVFEQDLFRNDHDEVARILRELSEILPELGCTIHLYEMPRDQTFQTGPQSGKREITGEILGNILRHADEELERQLQLMESEADADE